MNSGLAWIVDNNLQTLQKDILLSISASAANTRDRIVLEENLTCMGDVFLPDA